MSKNEIKDNYRYFKLAEFDSPDAPGSGKNMQPAFVDKIDNLRRLYGKPIKINSGFRTFPHNRIVGGVLDSAHLNGSAVDIPAHTSGDRFKLVRIAFNLGIKRIGIGQTFIHMDDDTTKPQELLWLY